MATPNYGYEKRQRELEKKRRKEEKARTKAARRAGGGADDPDSVAPAPDETRPDEGGGEAGNPGGAG